MSQGDCVVGFSIPPTSQVSVASWAEYPVVHHESSNLHLPLHTATEGETEEASRDLGSHRTSLIPPPSQQSAKVIQRFMRHIASAIQTWACGPVPPQIQSIKPLLPSIFNYPVGLLHRYLPKRRHRLLLLLAFIFGHLFAFVAVVHHSAFAGEIEGYGSPTQISCGATYWSDGNSCGLNGNACRPFSNATFAFRCPGDCLSRRVLNPHAVGTEEVIYRPLVVGGPVETSPNNAPVYRGDSFLCGSAIHAGAIRNAEGGCAVVTLLGARSSFPSSTRNEITSIAFDSSFPLSYSFLSGTDSGCRDLRWPLLGLSVGCTTILSLLTTSTPVFFFTTFVGTFFHVGLGSDPPNASGDYYTIVSLLLGRFLPSIFVISFLYRSTIRRTLTTIPPNVPFQAERTVFWLGGLWVGALTNYTFDFIPIQRLTPHDLDQQPGARAALAIIVLLVMVLVAAQIWYLRLEGRLPRFLALYASTGIILGLLAAIPGLSLRIHHYILALLLLPGTSIQTRPSLLYQGLLVGLFINGVARWGYDSILQTPGALLGDGLTLSPLPALARPIVTANSITFSFPATVAVLATGGTGNETLYDGISVLVNDVERYQYYAGYDEPHFTWNRKTDEFLRFYFRFAYLKGSGVGDYTKAGIWDGTGAWQPMADGPSR